MSYSEAAFIVASLIFTLVSIILITAQFYIMHALGISLFAAVTTFLYFDKEFEKLKKTECYRQIANSRKVIKQLISSYNGRHKYARTICKYSAKWTT